MDSRFSGMTNVREMAMNNIRNNTDYCRADMPVFVVDSTVPGGEEKEITVLLAPPSLEDNRSDLRRLTDAASEEFGIEIVSAMPEAIRKLPTVARSAGWQLTCVLAAEPERGDKLVGLRGVNV
jgi:hypothetical protein